MTFKILKLHKPLGVTPIQLWLSYRSRIFLPNMKAIESQRLPKGAICGKLDPMAEGELIILIEGDWTERDSTIFSDSSNSTIFSDSSDSSNSTISTIPSPLSPIPLSISISNKPTSKSPFGEVMDFLCNHEKIYEFGLVIGISTDSDDRLGMIENVECPKEPSSNDIRKNVEKELLQYAKNLKEQEYHIYSAKRAQNKEGTSQSLWCWKKQGRIHEIEIPRHECYIKEIEILEETINRPGQMSVKDFINKTICDLKTNRKNLIDFDIDKIIDNWSNFEHPVKQLEDLKIINVRVRVTTGTFIRQICRDLIRKTCIPMLCSYIDRKCVILNNE